MIAFTVIACLLAQAEPDFEAVGRIAVLHRGRPKPLDSFAREFMHEISGSSKFRGYKEGDKFIEVFKGGDPVGAVLRLIARPPEEVRNLRFLRIDHLALKEELKLDVGRLYFSLADLDAARPILEQREAEIVDRDNATVQQRAVLMIADKHWYIDAVCREQLLAIVPISYGELRSWPTVRQVKTWLDAQPGDPNVKAALDAFEQKAEGNRTKLEKIVDAYDRMMGGLAASRVDQFNAAGVELSAALATLNPNIYPKPSVIDAELTYNNAQPFRWVALILFVAALFYVASLVFDAPSLWWAAVLLQISSLVLHGYGYGLRWIACGQYPLSNHYESMMMLAAGASLIPLGFELTIRPKFIGMAGCIAAAVTIVLADNVYTFASQSFINPLQPALMNTVWMTIHVPVIMTAYASAMVMMILGHVYLAYNLFAPTRYEKLAQIDKFQHRMLQATVLFLLGGIILGAVWAGEAWGRPWGWDMKEVWALITLLTYLAVQHARFAGAIKGFGTAALAIASFASVILCYYGVNFLFGKGLHTYGFGNGDWLPINIYFGLEAVFVAVCVALRKKIPPPAAKVATGPSDEDALRS